MVDDIIVLQGMYGKIKVVGEVEVKSILFEYSVIICIFWVYLVYGNNFVKIMLCLMVEKL